jgi:transcription elongation factor Elf1
LELDLSAAVDVYSDWVDACDTVAKNAADTDGAAANEPYGDVEAPSRRRVIAERSTELPEGGDNDDLDADADEDYD